MSIKNYGLQDIKKELQHLPHGQVAELCLRLARYKKENKELLAYLLFEANDEQGFIEKVKAEVGFMFSQLPVQSYLATKSLRKILRLITKYVKFMGSKPAEIELLLYFCHNYLQYTDKKASYKPLRMILIRQIQKVNTVITKLHEDLQFDYKNDYNSLLDDSQNRYAWFYSNDYML